MLLIVSPVSIHSGQLLIQHVEALLLVLLLRILLHGRERLLSRLVLLCLGGMDQAGVLDLGDRVIVVVGGLQRRKGM